MKSTVRGASVRIAWNEMLLMIILKQNTKCAGDEDDDERVTLILSVSPSLTTTTFE